MRYQVCIHNILLRGWDESACNTYFLSQCPILHLPLRFLGGRPGERVLGVVNKSSLVCFHTPWGKKTSPPHLQNWPCLSWNSSELLEVPTWPCTLTLPCLDLCQTWTSGTWKGRPIQWERTPGFKVKAKRERRPRWLRQKGGFRDGYHVRASFHWYMGTLLTPAVKILLVRSWDTLAISRAASNYSSSQSFISARPAYSSHSHAHGPFTILHSALAFSRWECPILKFDSTLPPP